MSSAVVVSSENLDGQQQSSSTPASPAAEKVNLLGMSRAELEKFFEDIGEKKFRAGQVMKWIHQYFVTDFAEMTNISGKLRAKLEQICEIKAPEVVHRHYS
ncbi:23S rRNA (adenine(2503)-C(2))-methyltransferase RlmN, partial [Acinetobacter baumannii]|nr:23S rRNA (adenine(2503)-C(2))-methyltransferase RlmN [Acinetobacter baumannii]